MQDGISLSPVNSLLTAGAQDFGPYAAQPPLPLSFGPASTPDLASSAQVPLPQDQQGAPPVLSFGSAAHPVMPLVAGLGPARALAFVHAETAADPPVILDAGQTVEIGQGPAGVDGPPIGLGAVTGTLEAAQGDGQDLLGSDPAGGIAALVSLVSVTALFDLRDAGFDSADGGADPTLTMLDSLAADLAGSPLPILPIDPPAGDIPHGLE
ncbi:MAG TPA: hypothetical protein VMS43_01115 [Allosphingosinicella sp.]|nr:hypothetical protein [Allosphingosinicella sp.]